MDESILTTLRDCLLTRTSLENLPEDVWRRTSALNTWGTNAIEGNTLTWHDVEVLLIKKRSVGGRPIGDVLETLQHEKVFRNLIQQRARPITLVAILELHEAVFRGVKEDAGMWRRVNVRITGSKHVPPRMEKVVSEMEKMMKEYESRDVKGENALTLGTWFHHTFESIHPFSDGNGRVGRLLLNLHFLKHNWPPVNIVPSDRDRYLDCMGRGHSGDLSSFVDFVREIMGRSILDLLDQLGTSEDELRPLTRFEDMSGYSAKYLRLRA
ncbi:MAG: Fic family protein, partial [Candidatus Thermoplasmatota archaeon]|nr:Fic family protein [Candidatus Thermoplasmatota archaeon]